MKMNLRYSDKSRVFRCPSPRCVGLCFNVLFISILDYVYRRKNLYNVRDVRKYNVALGMKMFQACWE